MYASLDRMQESRLFQTTLAAEDFMYLFTSSRARTQKAVSLVALNAVSMFERTIFCWAGAGLIRSYELEGESLK